MARRRRARTGRRPRGTAGRRGRTPRRRRRHPGSPLTPTSVTISAPASGATGPVRRGDGAQATDGQPPVADPLVEEAAVLGERRVVQRRRDPDQRVARRDARGRRRPRTAPRPWRRAGWSTKSRQIPVSTLSRTSRSVGSGSSSVGATTWARSATSAWNSRQASWSSGLPAYGVVGRGSSRRRGRGRRAAAAGATTRREYGENQHVVTAERLCRHGGAADLRAPLEDEHGQSGAGQVRRGDESVVPASGHHHVIVSLGWTHPPNVARNATEECQWRTRGRCASACSCRRVPDRPTCRNIQSSTTVGAGDPRRTRCPPSPSAT